MSLASDFFGTQFAICLVFFYHVRILSPDRTKRKLPGKKRKERIWCAHAREAKKIALWSYFCRGICKKRGFISKHSTFVAFYGIAQQQISSNCSKKTKAKQQDQKEISLILLHEH